MLVQPKRHNLTVNAEIYDRISKIYKKEKTDKSMTQWISEKLLMVIEKDEFLQRYAPYLSKIAIDGSNIILRDEKLKRLVEITYRNKRFWCDVHESDCCIHVHFALALPETTSIKK